MAKNNKTATTATATTTATETATMANGNGVDTRTVIQQIKERVAEMKRLNQEGKSAGREAKLAAKRETIEKELVTLYGEFDNLSAAEKVENLKASARLLTKLERLEKSATLTPEEIAERRAIGKRQRADRKAIEALAAERGIEYKEAREIYKAQREAAGETVSE